MAAADEMVENVELVGDFEEEWLFRIEWFDRLDLLVQMLTNSEAAILNAVAADGQWKLRVLYPERELFSKIHAFCEEHGLTFDVSIPRPAGPIRTDSTPCPRG